jgi:hypothetical protein
MKKLNLLLLVGVALALPTVARATIIGSPHDFSTNSWNTRHGVCSPCHSAHNTDPAQLIPLWTHTTTMASFTPYSSPTLNAAVGQPDGASKACLSCHDGTVAINQYGGVTNGTPTYIAPGDSGFIGTDLHITHPVSFVFDTALAVLDGQLNDPVVYKIGDPVPTAGTTPPVPASWSGTSLTGKTLDQALLRDHKMQCVSCHDPHKQVGSAPTSGIMIKISGNDINGRGSLICRNCHLK